MRWNYAAFKTYNYENWINLKKCLKWKSTVQNPICNSCDYSYVKTAYHGAMQWKETLKIAQQVSVPPTTSPALSVVCAGVNSSGCCQPPWPCLRAFSVLYGPFCPSMDKIKWLENACSASPNDWWEFLGRYLAPQARCPGGGCFILVPSEPQWDWTPAAYGGNLLKFLYLGFLSIPVSLSHSSSSIFFINYLPCLALVLGHIFSTGVI